MLTWLDNTFNLPRLQYFWVACNVLVLCLIIIVLATTLLIVLMFFLFFIFAVDIISAIEFDKTGDHLATGDRGGRVVLFERTDTKKVGFCNLADHHNY